MLKDVKLRWYQEKILDELCCVPSIGLFMKTGSGKTLTSLARADKNPTEHLLIICPQKIVTQWWDVLEKYTDYSVCRYNINWTGKKKDDFISDFLLKDYVHRKCVVVNFDILQKIECLDWAVNDDWTIIVDESHKFKNMYKLDRSNNVKSGFVTSRILELGKQVDYKIILTATPTEKINGGYIDLYTQLKFLGYIDMSYQAFKNRYCYEESKQYPGTPFPIKQITGYRMSYIDNEIKPILQSCCRYYAPKYGDYEPQFIKVDIMKAKNYSKMLENKTYNEITFDNSSAFRIGKKTLSSGSVTGTDEYGVRYTYVDNTNKLDWLEEFMENTDDVVTITYNYNIEKDLIVELCKKLKKKYIVINGSIKDKPKEIQKEFDVLIGQYQAFGESIDGMQYKSHIMVMYSLPESSEVYKQTIGRIDRDGQTEMPVYYSLCMLGTIDVKIYEMLENKVEFSEKDLDDLTI